MLTAHPANTAEPRIITHVLGDLCAQDVPEARLCDAFGGTRDDRLLAVASALIGDLRSAKA
jgi:hypothetical protein